MPLRNPDPETAPSTVTPVEFDILASGDILLHGAILRAALSPATGRHDFRPMFAAIRPLVRRAALAICHVETPIGAGPPSTYPLVNAPASLPDAAGIRTTGTARTRVESRRILLLKRNGVRIALLAYTYGTNGLPLPHQWAVDLIERRRVAADARRARRLGADLILANFH